MQVSASESAGTEVLDDNNTEPQGMDS